jgi:signal transduction histidine kinase
MFNTNPLNGLGKTGEAYIVDENYTMITSSRFTDNAVSKIIVKTEGINEAFAGKPGTAEYKDYRDIMVFGSYSAVEFNKHKYVVVAEIDVREAMIPIYNLRNSIIILSIIIALIIFGIVFILSRRISSPIIKLKHAAESISGGNYDTFIENTSSDEIGDLTEAFNKMAQKLKIQTSELKEEKSKRITSVIDGQEQERQRLSRELHDGLGQYILAIKMKLERAENASPELRMQIIEEAKNLLVITSKEIISISENLAPPVLSEFGLVSAIENLCVEVKNNTGININFNYFDAPDKCDEKVKIYLYRIIQEALNNITKHSKASKADIIIKFDKKINLAISDNGIGFSYDENKKTGNGIFNMRDRTELLGGIFKIKTAPGEGTIIEIILENE